ncbi:MAG TPA: hypothetical protein VFL31_07470, partial [Nitrospiraceae bacterium]|nr:hypothetical protein [Nitrospiraceae bacterium]
KSVRYDRDLERFELPKRSAVRYLSRFILKKPRLRILVLDTLLHFIDRDNKKFRGGFSDNDTDAWYIIMPIVRKIAEETQCAILFTAHRTSKTGPRRASDLPMCR